MGLQTKRLVEVDRNNKNVMVPFQYSNKKSDCIQAGLICGPMFFFYKLEHYVPCLFNICSLTACDKFMKVTNSTESYLTFISFVIFKYWNVLRYISPVPESRLSFYLQNSFTLT